jgi:hypothetical protein
MTPHDQHYPPSADGSRLGTTQLLIGIVVVALVGILLLVSAD